jgi:hypothetical protein
MECGIQCKKITYAYHTVEGKRRAEERRKKDAGNCKVESESNCKVESESCDKKLQDYDYHRKASYMRLLFT